MRVEGSRSQTAAWSDSFDTSSGYSARATTAELINCPETGYLGAVVEPAILDRLPSPSSTAGKFINNLTNVYGLFDSINNDLCNRGRIDEESAGAVLEFIGRSTGTAISAGIGIKLTLLGSLFGPAGTAAGAGTGILLLKTVPPLAGQLARGGLNLFNDIIERTKEYLQRR